MRARSGGGAQLSRRGRRFTGCWLRPRRSQPGSPAAPSLRAAPPLPLNPLRAGDAAGAPPTRSPAAAAPRGPRTSQQASQPAAWPGAGVGETDTQGCKRKEASSPEAMNWQTLCLEAGHKTNWMPGSWMLNQLRSRNHSSLGLAPSRCLFNISNPCLLGTAILLVYVQPALFYCIFDASPLRSHQLSADAVFLTLQLMPLCSIVFSRKVEILEPKPEVYLKNSQASSDVLILLREQQLPLCG